MQYLALENDPILLLSLAQLPERIRVLAVELVPEGLHDVLEEVLLHFVKPSPDVHSGTVVEEVGERVRVERGRHDDHLEVRTTGKETLEHAEDEVHDEISLVHLVQDEMGDAAQDRIGLCKNNQMKGTAEIVCLLLITWPLTYEAGPRLRLAPSEASMHNIKKSIASL